LLVFPSLKSDHSQHMQRIRLLRLKRENVAAGCLGPIELAGLELLNAVLKDLGDGSTGKTR
jgi:hypothetical protein